MGQGRFLHPTRMRTITPHEAARLQGFPDFYDFSPASTVTALRKMIGNAVAPKYLLPFLPLVSIRGLYDDSTTSEDSEN